MLVLRSPLVETLYLRRALEENLGGAKCGQRKFRETRVAELKQDARVCLGQKIEQLERERHLEASLTETKVTETMTKRNIFAVYIGCG